ncbi:MAG: nucleoid-associated protein YgaU [Myxococcota bacterium]|jgi:nucleoid-associated protein YgaU
MSLLGSLSGLASAGIDMLVGGLLDKATLRTDLTDVRVKNHQILQFQFNPETITISRQQARSSTPVMGTADKKQDQNPAPTGAESTLVLKDVIFDTYERKPTASVYTEYIKTLEYFVGYDRDKHAPASLIFQWGRFTNDLDATSALKCKLENLTVDYTMFLNNGLPVRAKCNLTLRIGLTAEEQADENGMRSPDHAKLVTVTRGKSLSDIAAVEYDDPGQWRRIADANQIDDPMNLLPGSRLIVPPILK